MTDEQTTIRRALAALVTIEAQSKILRRSRDRETADRAKVMCHAAQDAIQTLWRRLDEPEPGPDPDEGEEPNAVACSVPGFGSVGL